MTPGGWLSSFMRQDLISCLKRVSPDSDSTYIFINFEANNLSLLVQIPVHNNLSYTSRT